MTAAATSYTTTNNDDVAATANIVLIGAGWWSQGWHLPHLHRNEKVNISAIVDSSPHPKSNLNPHLESLASLAQRYHCPVYHSLSDLFNDPSIGPNIDGAIVCTPHSTHFDIGKQLIAEGQRRYEEAIAPASGDDEDGVVTYRRMNVLMEKPMTTNVQEAKELHDLLLARREEESKRKRSSSSATDVSASTNASIIGGGMGCFLVNHSANYRPQARAAQELIQSSNKIGQIRHISSFFASPLSWIFDDPSNKGWNEPDDSGTMLGNGFAWGQSSHILAWIYHVVGPEQLIPTRVFCSMTNSDITGADVSHAATIICNNGATTFSLSGTSLLPGNAHSDPPVAKRIMIKIFGTKGAVVYSGNDRDLASGSLEYLRGSGHDDDEEGNDAHHIGAVEIHCPDLGFQFEELDQDGIGPESMQCFIDACLGRNDFYVGADILVGLRSVQTIDAMYRSNASGDCETMWYLVFGRDIGVQINCLRALKFSTATRREDDSFDIDFDCRVLFDNDVLYGGNDMNMGESTLEDRLATIIDKSSKDLYNISTEYYSQKKEWEGSLHSQSRPSRCASLLLSSPVKGSCMFDHIVKEIENSTPCGPYQQAAVSAFRAARNGSRHHSMGGRTAAAEDSHTLESRIQQNVDRLVNDKLKCTSIAIDALRDQLVILADEVRQLNRNATSQERRVDVLCHDADSRRGTINIMEAHMQEENSRIKSLGMEMERLKQEMATKASLVDVKTGLKSKLKRDNITVMNEVNDMKAFIQKQHLECFEKQMQQISTGTHAFQRNLVDAMKQTVHEEVALVEGKSLAMLEKEAQKISLQNKDERDKECVKVISQIVTKAATKIESNLRKELEKKVEKMIDEKLLTARRQDTELINDRIKKMAINDLSSIQDSLKELSIKQEKCIPRDEAELLTESCRAQLAQSMTRLEEQLATVTSKAIASSTSSSEAMLQKWKVDRENILNHLQHFVARDEASCIAEVMSKNTFDRCIFTIKEMEAQSDARIKSHVNESQQQTSQLLVGAMRDEAAIIAKSICYEQYEQWDRATAQTVEKQIDMCKAQLMSNFSMQLQNYTTKEEASRIAEFKRKLEAFQVTADCCHNTAGKIVDLEAKLEDIESDLGIEIVKLLNIVKSIDDRVYSMENKINLQVDSSKELARQCAQYDDINRNNQNIELTAVASHDETEIDETKVLQSPHREKEDSSTIQHPHDTIIQDFISFQLPNNESPVYDDDKSESSTTSESLSDRSCTSGSSPNHSVPSIDSKGAGEQRTLIQERNRMLSNVARTLSVVAAKRDDSSLRQLAEELRAGKLVSEHDPEPYRFDEDVQSEISTSQQSDVESIDTAEAMSLCGVKLDESHDGTRSGSTSRGLESPTSYVGAIDTAEAISLCCIRVPSDQYGEHDASVTKDEAHVPLHASFEEQRASIENSYTKSLLSSRCSSGESSSQSLQDLDKYSSTMKRAEFTPPQYKSRDNSSQQTYDGSPSSTVSDHSEGSSADNLSEAVRNLVLENQTSVVAPERYVSSSHFASRPLDDMLAAELTTNTLQFIDPDDDRLSRSTFDSPQVCHYAEQDVQDATVEMHVPVHIPTELQPLVNENDNSLPLPSAEMVSPVTVSHNMLCTYIDDEASLPGSLTSTDEVFDCNPTSYKYNPTRKYNPEPYRGWDALLTELKASGRTLRDGDSSEDSNSVSSYGSNCFERESEEIT